MLNRFNQRRRLLYLTFTKVKRGIMISCFFFVFSFSSFCNGFLLDTNTQGLSGNLMNEDRYDALLKLFMDERKARLQLQNYVIKQQQKIDTLDGLPERMEKVENVTDKISNLENSTASIGEKYSKLKRKCESLQYRQNLLESKLKAAENHTVHLEEELSSLRQVKAINQLQNLANLQQQMQTVQNNVNSLIVNSQARGQDMISMYKDLTVTKQKIVMFENDQQQMNINISVIEQTFKDNMTLIESSVNALQNQNLVVNSTLEDIIEHNRHG